MRGRTQSRLALQDIPRRCRATTPPSQCFSPWSATAAAPTAGATSNLVWSHLPCSPQPNRYPTPTCSLNCGKGKDRVRTCRFGAAGPATAAQCSKFAIHCQKNLEGTPATVSSAETLLDNRPPNRIASVRRNLGLSDCLATGKRTLVQRGLNATSKCFFYCPESHA